MSIIENGSVSEVKKRQSFKDIIASEETELTSGPSYNLIKIKDLKAFLYDAYAS